MLPPSRSKPTIRTLRARRRTTARPMKPLLPVTSTTPAELRSVMIMSSACNSSSLSAAMSTARLHIGRDWRVRWLLGPEQDDRSERDGALPDCKEQQCDTEPGAERFAKHEAAESEPDKQHEDVQPHGLPRPRP